LKFSFQKNSIPYFEELTFFEADGKDTMSIVITKFFSHFFRNFRPEFSTHFFLVTVALRVKN